ncbi:MAG: hypothetical protein ACRD3L_08745 [Terriglobales bacterium]
MPSVIRHRECDWALKLSYPAEAEPGYARAGDWRILLINHTPFDDAYRRLSQRTEH